jgi:hypothetical protein
MTAENADPPRPDAARSLAALAEERNELWVQAHRVKVLEREAAELRRLLAAREASLSWRLSAPLRRLRPVRARHEGPTPTPSDTSSASRS